MSSTNTKTTLEINPAESQLLAQEATAFATTLKDHELQQRYLHLAKAAKAGAVPSELIDALQTMLELLLQTQRARHLYGPQEEQLLLSLFHRTPRGKQLQQTTQETNDALQVLAGHTICHLSLSYRPGKHVLVVETDRCRLTLTLDNSAGAQIEDLQLG